MSCDGDGGEIKYAGVLSAVVGVRVVKTMFKIGASRN